jgi:hypothetical protein
MAHEVASSCSAEQSATSLLANSRWVRFEIVLGRIVAIPLCGGRHRTARSDPDSEPAETLNYNGDRDAPCFVYELRDAQQTLTVRCVGQAELHILRESESGERLLFMQSPRGAVSLSLGPEDNAQVLTAQSVWHLFLKEREACEQHVLPLLVILRPDWSLQKTGDDIEAHLCRRAAAALPRKRMAHLIAQLASPRFPQRQAADREIRSLGIGALPYLERVDRTRLNSEQRVRILRICDDLRTNTPDSPERVAAWLANDVRVWRDWREATEPSRRQAADIALAEMSGNRDPSGAPTSNRRVAELPWEGGNRR